MVEKGNSGFEAMSHAHPVLHLQKCRQKRLEVEVRHGVEVRLLADVGAVKDRLEAFPGIVLAEGGPIDLVAKSRRPIDETEVPAVEILEEAVPPELLEHRPVVPKCDKVGDDRFVGDDKLARVHRAFDGALDALLEVGHQVACVTAKDLIAPLPSQQDLAVLAGQARDHVLRERPWAGHRVIEVIDDLLDALDKIARGDIDVEDLEAFPFRELARKCALVVRGISSETTGETKEARTLSLGCQGSDDAGVETATHICADRNVRAEMERHRLSHEVLDLSFEIGRLMVEVGRVVHLPVAADINVSVANGERMAG